MIRKLVDFALENRFLMLAAAILLFGWGAISFHQLPIEAYPDVADNYVEIITQWPGISAEQIEQQVTIPLEISMNGIPHVTHLRSFSLFGLSDLKLIFDADEQNSWNRERVLERFSCPPYMFGWRPRETNSRRRRSPLQGKLGVSYYGKICSNLISVYDSEKSRRQEIAGNGSCPRGIVCQSDCPSKAGRLFYRPLGFRPTGSPARRAR
jgi:AcrB/AcrD/AcrF family